MSAFVDTSILVRYLTGDPPGVLEAARHIVEATPELRITPVVLAETAYVLTSVYGVSRQMVVDHLIDLLSRENIIMHGLAKDLAMQALLLCRPSKRVSFADALLWAAARGSSRRGEEPTVYTFDERFPASGVRLAKPT